MKFKFSQGISLLELVISMALAMIVLMGVSYQIIFITKQDIKVTQMQELEQLRDVIRTRYDCQKTVARLLDDNCSNDDNKDIAISCDNTPNKSTTDLRGSTTGNQIIELRDASDATILNFNTAPGTFNYASYVVRAVCCDNNPGNNLPDPFIKVEARLNSTSETAPWQDIFSVVPLPQCFN